MDSTLNLERILNAAGSYHTALFATHEVHPAKVITENSIHTGVFFCVPANALGVIQTADVWNYTCIEAKAALANGVLKQVFFGMCDGGK